MSEFKRPPLEKQNFLLLHLPEAQAEKVRNALKEEVKLNDNGEEIEELTMSFEPRTTNGEYSVDIGGEAMSGVLVNLPTIMEVQKTSNKKIFHKSGDIGQMLIVVEDDSEIEPIKKKLVRTEVDIYYPHGLTPPTTNIVTNRFEKARKYGGFSHHEVADATKIYDRMQTQLSNKSVVIEEIEDIVDAEDWMVSTDEPDGIEITVDLNSIDWTSNVGQILLAHPEFLLSSTEYDEYMKQRSEQERKEDLRQQEQRDKDLQAQHEYEHGQYNEDEEVEMAEEVAEEEPEEEDVEEGEGPVDDAKENEATPDELPEDFF